MLFTSSPKHQALEHMMRQVPKQLSTPSEDDPPEYTMGAYSVYLKRLPFWQSESRAIGDAATYRSLSWRALIVLMASPFRNPLFEKRIQTDILSESEDSKMIYKTRLHHRLFKQAVRERKATDRIFQAVLFLLTSNHLFWNRIRIHVTMNAINFDNFPMNRCTAEEYTLFCCAKDLYTGTRHITVTDLADPGVVSMEQFKVICNAMTIARYGLPGKQPQPKKGEPTT